MPGLQMSNKLQTCIMEMLGVPRAGRPCFCRYSVMTFSSSPTFLVKILNTKVRFISNSSDSSTVSHPAAAQQDLSLERQP